MRIMGRSVRRIKSDQELLLLVYCTSFWLPCWRLLEEKPLLLQPRPPFIWHSFPWGTARETVLFLLAVIERRRKGYRYCPCEI
jgi:hypothetical protein